MNFSPASARVSRTLACALLALFGSSACAAVFPEVKTPLKTLDEGSELAPPPPDDLLYLYVQSADIPEKTRDGRGWDAVGGEAPDPVAKVFLNDVELFRTEVEANTFKPTWPEQPKANYRIPLHSKVRVEVWDINAIYNLPICVKKLRSLHDASLTGDLAVLCNGGARVILTVAPARPMLGLGFFYELHSRGVAVTRVFQESPAGRAGMKKGDEIIDLMGKAVKGLNKGEAQSLVNANASIGVQMILKRGTEEISLKLKRGPGYGTAQEGISFGELN